MSAKYWILCGSPENWNVAFEGELWGLIPKFEGKWRYAQPEDWLFFYATSPVSGVIGAGRLLTKFKQDKPIWPDEIAKKEVLYPFRFEFKSEYIIPASDWGSRRIKIKLPWGSYSAMNLLDDQNIIENIQDNIKQQWNNQIDFGQEMEKLRLFRNDTSKETIDLSHDKIKDMIFEIGKMDRYISEKEYSINSERLDVVWRRVERSVPTYAFEVQIGGNPYQALAKLHHAYNIWNSNIYLITENEQRDKIDEILGGSFHEIKNVVNVANLRQVNDLYSLQQKDVALRHQIGLP
jgi:predicted RNA-binding protein